MAETLLSQSNILLFGRVVEDLKIKEDPSRVIQNTRRVRLSSTAALTLTDPLYELDGFATNVGNRILIMHPSPNSNNGIYKIGEDFIPIPIKKAGVSFKVYVNAGVFNGKKYFEVDRNGLVSLIEPGPDDPENGHNPFQYFRTGKVSELQQQLSRNGAKFARIYGFSYEGHFYTIPYTIYFMVHGAGVPANEVNVGGMEANPSRAPANPSLGGVGAADFELADDMMVWSYDQADYTIRLDVQNGMFEQVLLDAMLGGGSSPDVSGMNARGMNARGMNARGMNARGMNARGMNARGGNSD